MVQTMCVQMCCVSTKRTITAQYKYAIAIARLDNAYDIYSTVGILTFAMQSIHTTVQYIFTQLTAALLKHGIQGIPVFVPGNPAIGDPVLS